jgi:hypothetical protein
MLNPTYSTHGMAVAPHALASQSALAILREGGNAIEAMVAAAASIAVVYPHMNSIGGDGFWLHLAAKTLLRSASMLAEDLAVLPRSNAISAGAEFNPDPRPVGGEHRGWHDQWVERSVGAIDSGGWNHIPASLAC